jgi:hypothetical protein
MQTVFTSSTPLAAGAQFTSAWFQADPNFPFVTITAGSDVAGSLVLYESDNNPQQLGGGDGSANVIAGLSVIGGLSPASQPVVAPVTLQAPVRGLYWRVVYTNGPAVQTAFLLNLNSSTVTTDTSTNRKLDLLLREMRAHSMLLMYLKEPTGSIGANIPFGLGDLTQGTIFPGAPAITAPPPIPQTPAFD